MKVNTRKRKESRKVFEQLYGREEQSWSGKIRQVHKWGNCSTMTHKGGSAYEQKTEKESCTCIQGKGSLGNPQG